jgi:hypothetical protein
MFPLRQTAALCLSLIAPACLAENLTNPHPHRVINGHLYDFTAIQRLIQPGRSYESTPPHVIKGYVVFKPRHQGEIYTAINHYRGPSPIEDTSLLTASPGELLRRRTAELMVKRGFSFGQWQGFDPMLRRDLTDAKNRLNLATTIGDTEYVLIKDAPTSLDEKDEVVFFALACKPIVVPGAKGEPPITYRTFMIGTPTTNLSEYPTIWKVSPQGTITPSKTK